MRMFDFDKKPDDMTEEEFKAEIIEGVLMRLKASDRIVRALEYYYVEEDDERLDFATEKTGTRKLCLFFKLCVVYDGEIDADACFHRPVLDMILAAVGGERL